jgi:hypothetical protein
MGIIFFEETSQIKKAPATQKRNLYFHECTIMLESFVSLPALSTPLLKRTKIGKL